MNKELVFFGFFVLYVVLSSYMVYIAFSNRAKPDGNKLLAIFTFCIAIYWLVVYFSGAKTVDWWNPYILIHIANFLIFSGLVYTKYKYAYIILLLDLILSVVVFLLHNYTAISKFIHVNIISYVNRYSIKIT